MINISGDMTTAEAISEDRYVSKTEAADDDFLSTTADETAEISKRLTEVKYEQISSRDHCSMCS